MNLNIYKRGQAKNTRLWTAILMFVVGAYGCYVLHLKLKALNNIWVETLIPFGLCAAIAVVLAWLMNKPSIADFMIVAEGEIKKVSWSTRKEIIASTSVVIFVMLAISIFLYAVDMVFINIFMGMGLY